MKLNKRFSQDPSPCDQIEFEPLDMGKKSSMALPVTKKLTEIDVIMPEEEFKILEK